MSSFTRPFLAAAQLDPKYFFLYNEQLRNPFHLKMISAKACEKNSIIWLVSKARNQIIIGTTYRNDLDESTEFPDERYHLTRLHVNSVFNPIVSIVQKERLD